jgi:hypothetical protein
LVPLPQSPPASPLSLVLPTELLLAPLLVSLVSSALLLTSCKRRAPFAPSHETISFSIDNIMGYQYSHMFHVHDVVWSGWNEEERD